MKNIFLKILNIIIPNIFFNILLCYLDSSGVKLPFHFSLLARVFVWFLPYANKTEDYFSFFLLRVNYSFSPYHKHWLSTLLSSLLQAIKAKFTFHVGASKHFALLFSPPQTFLLFSTYYFPFITSMITLMFWI
jgi:hypothetical protein